MKNAITVQKPIPFENNFQSEINNPNISREKVEKLFHVIPKAKRMELLKTATKKNQILFVSSMLNQTEHIFVDEIRDIFRIAIVETKSIDMIQFFINKLGYDKLGKNEIFISIEAGNLNVVKLFLDYDMKLLLDSKIHLERFARFLNSSSNYGHLELVKFFESKIKEKINDTNSGVDVFLLQSVHLALKSAAEKGHIHIIKYFVESDPNGVEKYLQDGKSKLILSACRFQRFDLLKYLFQNNARFDDVDKYRASCFFHAVNTRNLDIIRFFIEKKVDLDAENEDAIPPLCLCCSQLTSMDVVRLLVKSGANVNVQPKNGRQTPLQIACYAGNLNLVTLLAVNGADLNLTNPITGESPFFISVQRGFASVIKYFLSQPQVDFNKPNIKGETPLLAAANSGNFDNVKHLVEKGKVDLNFPNLNGDTPLMTLSSIGYGNQDIVLYLIQKGAKVELENNQKQTALLGAIKNERIEIVKLLIENGKADVTNALSIVAAYPSDSKVRKYFIERGILKL